jgi:hypothetical protein
MRDAVARSKKELTSRGVQFDENKFDDESPDDAFKRQRSEVLTALGGLLWIIMGPVIGAVSACISERTITIANVVIGAFAGGIMSAVIGAALESVDHNRAFWVSGMLLASIIGAVAACIADGISTNSVVGGAFLGPLAIAMMRLVWTSVVRDLFKFLVSLFK